MKIWELLSDEYEGKLITNEDNSLKLQIKKDEAGDIVLANFQGQNVAISKMLLDEAWDFAEVKGWERSMMNSQYFYIDDTGRVKPTSEDATIKEELRYEIGNYFSTEEKANDVFRFEFINRLLMKVADTNNEEIDWTNEEQEKYCITYNASDDNFEVTSVKSNRVIGVVYFSNKDVAQRALELALEKLREYYRN